MKGKEVNWFKANAKCIAMGNAVALNLMFERHRDHQRFLVFWDKYLGAMTKILRYDLTPTGWTILFETYSEEKIKHAYVSQRQKSRKAKAKYMLKDTSKMISEHFRIFLSQYARRSNAKWRRRGTLVMEKFRKYVLPEKVNVDELFTFITKYSRKNQFRSEYRADESRYDREGEMTKESHWKSGVLRDFEKLMEKNGVNENGFLDRFKDSVLRKYIIKSSRDILPRPDS